MLIKKLTPNFAMQLFVEFKTRNFVYICKVISNTSYHDFISSPIGLYLDVK